MIIMRGEYPLLVVALFLAARISGHSLICQGSDRKNSSLEDDRFCTIRPDWSANIPKKV
ncbi:Uncharacterized protein dnm_059720 [Desulfonema magnum]|uniref:Uncharacterized protein n=1 Tax=Desulfonema magnum TaxID=45655 RepID=A0A975BR79_9BACT|nr:Uncharacterized protein dnm_059720 [Desulfonema magnum]